MRLVVKVGGAQLVADDARRAFAESVVAARGAGHEVVVVHGGGEQIRRLTERLGIPEQKVRGLRVTDAATAEAALMVLGGQVNRTLVAALTEAGAPAVGLTGADGGLFRARAAAPELGLVGDVAAVDPRVVACLLAGGFVPVVASIARGDGAPPGAFYNINADHVVAPLARALDADAVLFLTDVEGVRGASGERLARLDVATAAELIGRGVIAGGMIPKAETACATARQNPRATVRIAPADRPDAILHALRDGIGTEFSTARATCDG